MNEEERIKDLKAVYSGAIQSGEIGIANMIKGGIDTIEKIQKENKYMHNELDKQQTKINKYAKENELAKQALIKNSNIADERNQLLKENEELKILKDDIQDKRIIYIDTPEFEENYISKQKIKDKIKKLDKEEQELQNSISSEEREEHSDANISWNLMDINIRREVLQELIEESGEK